MAGGVSTPRVMMEWKKVICVEPTHKWALSRDVYICVEPTHRCALSRDVYELEIQLYASVYHTTAYNSRTCTCHWYVYTFSIRLLNLTSLGRILKRASRRNLDVMGTTIATYLHTCL